MGMCVCVDGCVCVCGVFGYETVCTCINGYVCVVEGCVWIGVIWCVCGVEGCVWSWCDLMCVWCYNPLFNMLRLTFKQISVKKRQVIRITVCLPLLTYALAQFWVIRGKLLKTGPLW